MTVIFILVLFPLRDAPGCSPICPFDSHTHKLTHAKALTNSYDLCNSHLFFLWFFFKWGSLTLQRKWVTMPKCDQKTEICLHSNSLEWPMQTMLALIPVFWCQREITKARADPHTACGGTTPHVLLRIQPLANKIKPLRTFDWEFAPDESGWKQTN